LVKKSGLSCIGEAEDKYVVVAIGLEDLAPHGGKEASHDDYYLL
jgi:hypothetical protein